MNVSIIGASGFIGQALCRVLEEQGHEVYAPARGTQSKPKGGWGRVVWAAGLTANFRQKPMETVQAHVSDLADLLQTGDIEGMVYLSSTRVYQRSLETEEDTALPCLSADPSDLYNLSKLMGESLCLNAGVERVKIARLSNIVGPDEAQRTTFIGALCREAQNGKITLQSAPHSSKDYLWITDAVSYLAAMALDDHTGVFNVARGIQIEHMQWAETIASQFDAEISSDANAPNGGFAPINVNKLHTVYGPAKADPLENTSHIVSSA